MIRQRVQILLAELKLDGSVLASACHSGISTTISAACVATTYSTSPDANLSDTAVHHCVSESQDQSIFNIRSSLQVDMRMMSIDTTCNVNVSHEKLVMHVYTRVRRVVYSQGTSIPLTWLRKVSMPERRQRYDRNTPMYLSPCNTANLCKCFIIPSYSVPSCKSMRTKRRYPSLP